jgi:hypothetical protein
MNPALHAVLRAIVLGVITFAVIFATSCTLRIDSDGAKSFSLDGEQAARAILIYSEK